jgi:hypothetical protein
MLDYNGDAFFEVLSRKFPVPSTPSRHSSIILA